MSIHVCKCTHNGREEYHLRYPGMTEAEARELADRINGGWLRPPLNQVTGTAIARVVESDDFAAEVSWLLNPLPPGTLLYEA